MAGRGLEPEQRGVSERVTAGFRARRKHGWDQNGPGGNPRGTGLDNDAPPALIIVAKADGGVNFIDGPVVRAERKGSRPRSNRSDFTIAAPDMRTIFRGTDEIEKFRQIYSQPIKFKNEDNRKANPIPRAATEGTVYENVKVAPKHRDVDRYRNLQELQRIVAEAYTGARKNPRRVLITVATAGLIAACVPPEGLAKNPIVSPIQTGAARAEKAAQTTVAVVYDKAVAGPVETVKAASKVLFGARTPAALAAEPKPPGPQVKGTPGPDATPPPQASDTPSNGDQTIGTGQDQKTPTPVDPKAGVANFDFSPAPTDPAEKASYDAAVSTVLGLGKLNTLDKVKVNITIDWRNNRIATVELGGTRYIVIRTDKGPVKPYSSQDISRIFTPDKAPQIIAGIQGKSDAIIIPEIIGKNVIYAKYVRTGTKYGQARIPFAAFDIATGEQVNIQDPKVFLHQGELASLVLSDLGAITLQDLIAYPVPNSQDLVLGPANLTAEELHNMFPDLFPATAPAAIIEAPKPTATATDTRVPPTKTPEPTATATPDYPKPPDLSSLSPSYNWTIDLSRPDFNAAYSPQNTSGGGDMVDIIIDPTGFFKGQNVFETLITRSLGSKEGLLGDGRHRAYVATKDSAGTIGGQCRRGSLVIDVTFNILDAQPNIGINDYSKGGEVHGIGGDLLTHNYVPDSTTTLWNNGGKIYLIPVAFRNDPVRTDASKRYGRIIDARGNIELGQWYNGRTIIVGDVGMWTFLRPLEGKYKGEWIPVGYVDKPLLEDECNIHFGPYASGKISNLHMIQRANSFNFY